MKFKMLLFLALIMLPSIAQSNGKCLEDFTHDYFDWFKGVLRSSPSGSITETIKAEKRELANLFQLLDSANETTCSARHELQMKGLTVATKSLNQMFDLRLKEVEAGNTLLLGDDVREAKSKYRAYNAKLVKQLMKETGIRW